MAEGFYCERCRDYVPVSVSGKFQHPDLGIRPATTCPNCNHMVYIKKKEEDKKEIT